MKLRPYQRKSALNLLGLLKLHRRVVAVSPTGSGKTAIGAAVVRLSGHNLTDSTAGGDNFTSTHPVRRSGRVLWLAHRIELLRQARRELIKAGLTEAAVGILAGAEKCNEGARVLVASVDMFRSRLVPDVGLIVVDEAHHVTANSYRDITDVKPNAMVLGLTATPERLDGEPLGDVFRHMHVAAEAVELIADGFLLEANVYGIPLEKARDLVRGAHSGGGKDYSGPKLERAMAKRPLMADIVQEYQRLAPGERAIVYSCGSRHGQALTERFAAAGIPVAYVDRHTKQSEREALLAPGGKLASGEILVVVNVGVLTEGFDCPSVSCIIVARPTKSLALWRQMCGRGARPQEGKRFLVLDHAGNTWRHGYPDTPIPWSLEGRDREAGPQPFKHCPSCNRMNPISAARCANCGAEFPIAERELSEQEAELERLQQREDEKRSREQAVRRLALERGYDEAWVRGILDKAS